MVNHEKLARETVDYVKGVKAWVFDHGSQRVSTVINQPVFTSPGIRIGIEPGSYDYMGKFTISLSKFSDPKKDPQHATQYGLVTLDTKIYPACAVYEVRNGSWIETDRYTNPLSLESQYAYLYFPPAQEEETPQFVLQLEDGESKEKRYLLVKRWRNSYPYESEGFVSVDPKVIHERIDFVNQIVRETNLQEKGEAAQGWQILQEIHRRTDQLRNTLSDQQRRLLEGELRAVIPFSEANLPVDALTEAFLEHIREQLVPYRSRLQELNQLKSQQLKGEAAVVARLTGSTTIRGLTPQETEELQRVDSLLTLLESPRPNELAVYLEGLRSWNWLDTLIYPRQADMPLYSNNSNIFKTREALFDKASRNLLRDIEPEKPALIERLIAVIKKRSDALRDRFEDQSKQKRQLESAQSRLTDETVLRTQHYGNLEIVEDEKEKRQ